MIRLALCVAAVFATTFVAALHPCVCNAQRGVVLGELGLYSGTTEASALQTDAVVVSPMLGGYARIGDKLQVGALWGASYVDASATVLGTEMNGSQFEVGNPYILAAYAIGLGDRVVMRVGGGLTIPLSMTSSEPDFDDAVGAAGLAIASSMRGGWNGWMWSPDTFALVLPSVRLDLSMRAPVKFGFEFATAVMVDTSGDREDAAEFAAQFKLEGSYTAAQVVRVGARFRLVWVPTVEGDNAQVAAEPFVRVLFPPGFAEARLVMNLDEPAGFSFDEGKIWGLHVGGGASF